MNLVSLNDREGTVTLLGNTAALPVCEFQKTDRFALREASNWQRQQNKSYVRLWTARLWL